MDNENELPQVEETVEEETTTVEQEHNEDQVVLSKADYTKLNRKAIAYETIKKNPPKQESPVAQVDSVDLIKLGKKLQDYSDEELDFVTEFAKSKKPEDILKALENPFVKQGVTASREKAEKERLSLTPSGTQPETDLPQTLESKLAKARTIAEKQEILEELGLYSEPGHNPNRVIIKP